MATTTQAGKKNFVDFDEFIEFQLKKTSSNIKLIDILTAVAGVAAMVIGYLLVFVVFDHWVVDGGFGNTTRWLMLGGLLVSATTWVIWKVVLPARKNITGLYAARTIELTEPGLKSGLVNLVDLQRAGRPVPEHIRTAMEKQTAVALAKTNVDEAVDRRPLMRLSYVLLALVVLFCLYTLMSPKTISGSIWRALMPASDTAVDTTVKIDKVSVVLKNPQTRADVASTLGDKLLPADVTIPARSKVEVVVDLLYNDEPPEAVTLYYTTQDGKFVDVPLTLKADPDEVKRFRGVIDGEHGRGILQNTTYRIEAGDAKAGPFQITVTHPPIATVTSLTYEYPAYTEREDKVQQGGHINALEGTTVRLRAVSDRPVREAWIVFHNTEDITKTAGRKMMTVTAGTDLAVELRSELEFRPDGGYPHFYHILCKDKSGLTDPRPVLYGVTLHRDEPPKVEIVDPAGNEIELPANTEKLPILYKAHDPDFKLRFVTLRSEMTRQGDDGQPPAKFDEPVSQKLAKSIRETHDWPLQALRAKPGDSVRFRLEARDNKTPVANLGFSRWITVRFVAPVDQQELQKQAEQRRKQQQQKQKQDEGGADQDPPNNPPENPDQKDGGKGAGDQQQKGDKSQEGGMAGDKGKKGKQSGGMGERKQGDDPQPGENPQQQNGDGPGTQPPKPDANGGLSQEQLRQLNNERMKEEQRKREKGEQPKGGNTPDGAQSPDGTPNQEQKPGGMNQQPGTGNPQTGQPKPGMQDPGMKDSGMKDSGMKDSGMKDSGMKDSGMKDSGMKDSGMKDSGMKDSGMKDSGMKDSGMKDSGMKDSGMGNAAGNKKENKDGAAGGGKKGMQDAGGMRKGTPSKSGQGKSSNDMKKTGTASTPDKAKPETGQPGAGTQQKKSTTDEMGRDSKKPVNGMEKAAPGKKATSSKPGTGNEKGMAEPNENKGAKTTKATNQDQIKTDPTKKKVTRPSEEPGSPKKKEERSGSPNPKQARQKSAGAKQKSNPDKRPTPARKVDDQASKTDQNRQNPPGNQKIQKDGQATGRKKDNTDRGQAGKSTPSDQGAGGSKKRGAGDNSPQAGKQGDAAGKITGMPGQKPGKGSGKTASGSKPDGMPQTPDGGMGQPGKSNPGAQKPGNVGGSPMGGQPKDVPRNGGEPGGGTGPFNEEPNPRQNKPLPPDGATPQAKTEYGKKAVDLTLKYLEDKLKRGEADENWLKRHGFSSKEQLKNAIDRSRNRLEQGDLSKAQKLQREQFLRSIYDEQFQAKSNVRRGTSVRQRNVEGVGSSDISEPPPQLREYYRKFTESVGGGRSKR